jgi:uncharacterized protein with NRDE domain
MKLRFLLEREFNKVIKRNAKDIKIDYEASDMQDLRDWAEDNDGYIELATDVFYTKDGKISFVSNVRSDYNFKTGVFEISPIINMAIPIDVVKKLKKSKLKKNGKDIVFYHGTDADFKEFSNEFEGKNFTMGNYWKGMYFTDTEEYAKTFGKHMKRVCLNSQKPLYTVSNKFKQIEDDWKESKYNKLEDFILSLGYDTIIHIDKKRSRMTEVIVFDAKIIINLEN